MNLTAHVDQHTYRGYTMSFSLWCRNNFSRNLIRLPVIIISRDDLSATEQIIAHQHCHDIPKTTHLCDRQAQAFCSICQTSFTICRHQLNSNHAFRLISTISVINSDLWNYNKCVYLCYIYLLKHTTLKHCYHHDQRRSKASLAPQT